MTRTASSHDAVKHHPHHHHNNHNLTDHLLTDLGSPFGNSGIENQQDYFLTDQFGNSGSANTPPALHHPNLTIINGQFHPSPSAKVVRLPNGEKSLRRDPFYNNNNQMATKTRNRTRGASATEPEPPHEDQENILPEKYRVNVQPELENDGTPYYIDTRWTKDVLHRELIKVVRGIEHQRALNDEQEATIKTQAAEIKELKQQNKEMANRSDKLATNDAEKEEIKRICEKNVFHYFRFIEDEEDEQKACLLCYKYLQAEKAVANRLTGQKLKDHRKMWMKTYNEWVTSCINTARGNIQQRLRAAIMELAQEGFFPTLDEIRSCIIRDVNLEKNDDGTWKHPRMATIFEWWVTNAASKCAGGDAWNKEHWLSVAMSKYADPHFDNSKTENPVRFFVPSMEAIMFNQLDNCYVKFDACINYYRSENNFKKKLPGAKKKYTNDQGERVKDPDPMYDNKYSIVDGGQKRFETWTQEGIDAYGEILDFIRADWTTNRKQRLKKETELRKHLLAKEEAEEAKGKKTKKRSREKEKTTVKQPDKKARRLSSEDEDQLMAADDESDSEGESETE